MSDRQQQRGGGVHVAGVHHGYDGHEVIHGLDLDVLPGETMVIIGGSGEGKSVLLRLMAGLESAATGTVEVGGIDIGAYVSTAPEDKPFRTSMVFLPRPRRCATAPCSRSRCSTPVTSCPPN